MAIINVLKRKDASSVVVAVVVAMIVSQLVSSLTVDIARRLSGLGDSFAGTGAGTDWQTLYLLPLVTALLQLLALELLIWLYTGVKDLLTNKK